MLGCAEIAVVTFRAEAPLDHNVCGTRLSRRKLCLSQLDAVDAPSLVGACRRERGAFKVVEIATLVDLPLRMRGAACKKLACRKEQSDCEILHLHANAGVKRRRSRPP